jgi:hypothetical protein
MVLAALVDGGRLIGLVDGREKGGQLPFGESDRQRAAAIAEVLTALVRELGLARSLEAPGAAGEGDDRRRRRRPSRNEWRRSCSMSWPWPSSSRPRRRDA